MEDILKALDGKSKGILRASDCLRSLDQCIGGVCPGSLFEGFTSERWASFVKEADAKLVYVDDALEIKEIATKGMALSSGSILDFDCIVTTNTKDRDEDILETKGAELDDYAPLLMFHNPDLPIGALVSKGLHTDEMLTGRFKILDTALGRDAKTLVEGGALRISHGFEPTDYVPLKGGRYHIRKFKIYEVSLVPVPANPMARITAHFSGKGLETPFFKQWAKQGADERPVIVPGVDIDADGNVKHECLCSKAAASEAIQETEIPETKDVANVIAEVTVNVGADDLWEGLLKRFEEHLAAQGIVLPKTAEVEPEQSKSALTIDEQFQKYLEMVNPKNVDIALQHSKQLVEVIDEKTDVRMCEILNSL